jgi:hypothetical protein
VALRFLGLMGASFGGGGGGGGIRCSAGRSLATGRAPPESERGRRRICIGCGACVGWASMRCLAGGSPVTG